MPIDALAIAKAVAAEKAPAVEVSVDSSREPSLQALYAALQPLAGLGQFEALDRGTRLIVGSHRGEIEVSRTGSWVDVTIRELVSFTVDRSRFGETNEIRYKKGKTILKHFMCGGEHEIVTVREGIAAPRQFSQVDDAVRYVAETIGAMLGG